MISPTAPTADEVEYSVFGPGYGESILVHVTGGDWIIVDSCVSHVSKRAAALEYLARIGVDAGTAVKLVIATHWHDDHVRGLAEIVDACSSSRFVVSQALFAREFTTLVGRFGEVPPGITGIDEFRRILGRRRMDVLETLGYASAGKLVWGKPGIEGIRRSVTSLSPHDAAITRGIENFAGLLSSHDPRHRILPRGPNECSVVLSIEVGATKALLGADLEADGWAALLEADCCPRDPASFFKVPHHGAESSHVDDVWTRLLVQGPVAVVTPFTRKRLPSTNDVNRMCSRTDQAYITSNFLRANKRGLPSVVTKMIDTVTIPQSFRLQPRLGHVRLRCKADASSPQSWHVELSPEAEKLVSAQ